MVISITNRSLGISYKEVLLILYNTSEEFLTLSTPSPDLLPTAISHLYRIRMISWELSYVQGVRFRCTLVVLITSLDTS